VRKLADATVRALRQVPSAPGLRFRLYLGVWDKLTDPVNPQVRLTNFDDYLVQDSISSIDWTLERSYAQLSPGDIQFQVRDVLDQFEACVNNDFWGPVEVQIWAAPAWGGAGDWAMLFHGYVEPSGITRAQAEPGDATEPTVPLKDVYAKSYLSARLDAMLAEPLGAWAGVQKLQAIVELLGDRLISVAGHEPIDYDLKVATIPTKDDRLVLSAWKQAGYGGAEGTSWIVREDDRYWTILQWRGLYNPSVFQFQLDKRTYDASGFTQILSGPAHATYGRFHYVDSTYILLTISKRENFTDYLSAGDFVPIVLKEAVLIRRSDSAVIARWDATAHMVTTGGYGYKPLGYCAVADTAGEKHLVLWLDRYWDAVGGIPAWDDSFVIATLSMTDLIAGNDCGWNSGIISRPGYVCGGATCSTDNAGVIHASATMADLVNPGRVTYLVIATSADGGATFAVAHSNLVLGAVPLGTMRDDAHEHSRPVAGHAIYENEDAGKSWYLFGNVGFALTQTPPLYLQEYRHDNNQWSESIALVDHTGHHHLVHYYTLLRTGTIGEDFYAPGTPDTLRIEDGGGYFVKLNWVALASRGVAGTTGNFWGWRSYASAPFVLIANAFWPLFDLDNAGPADDETVRAFIGRLCEATGHMMLFPGRATPQGPIIWRVRPRHTQPPDYCLTARDILADGIDVAGPRKLRLIVTTQGATYAYPDTETLALARMSELSVSNDGIPPSVADDFAYWLWLLFETQNRVVKCKLDALLHVEVGDSVDVSLGLVDYLQGVVTRQSLDSASGRGRCEMLCAVAVAGVNRLTPKTGEAE